MRSLSDTLLAAQQSASAVPFVKVEVHDRVAGVARLHWERLYTGTEPDSCHAAAMPGDGSLLKVRVAPGSYRLYRQRVASPGPGSDFASWTQMEEVSSSSGIALACKGASVFLFSVGTNKRSVQVRESSDYGATFGAPATVVTAGDDVGWLAAGISASDVVAVFYSVGGTVYVLKRTGGSWGSPAPWTNSASSISGLACVYQGDWNLTVCGQDSDANYHVWTCICGDGVARPAGVWSPLEELTVASEGSSVEFRCCFLDQPDSYRLFFVEKYAGQAAYQRPFWSYTLSGTDFAAGLWREPVPFDLVSNYGVAVAHAGSYAWLARPDGVWRAPFSASSVAITGDVLSLVMTATPNGGRCRVELRNDDGRYADIGSGSYAAIKEGSEVLVSPGYRTTVGDEVSDGPAYWIDGLDHVSRAGEAVLVVEAGDGWSLLERWRARRQFTWASGQKTVYQLLSFILARSGLELSSLSTSGIITSQRPAFTIHPDETGAGAVRRLLAMVPDVLFFRDKTACVLHPQASDAGVYSYGAGHALREGKYGSRSPAVNRVQVFGGGVLGEAFSWAELEKQYDGLLQVHDLNLDTAAKAGDRAEAELRRAEIGRVEGWIVVPANCGQELYDVVDITDGRAGLSAAKRRVLGLDLRYARSGQSPRYQHRIALGGV